MKYLDDLDRIGLIKNEYFERGSEIELNTIFVKLQNFSSADDFIESSVIE